MANGKHFINFLIFIYGLFNDDVSTPEHTASNEWMIIE